MFKIPLLFVATLLAASLVTAETAYFALQAHETHNEFIIQLNDDVKIEQARRILDGEETEDVHPNGIIVKSTAPYNPYWNFYMEPDTIEFLVPGSKSCESSLDVLKNVLLHMSDKIPDGVDMCPNAPIVREVWLDEDGQPY